MELPAPSSPQPPPPPRRWAMLRRVPELSRVDLSQDDFALELAAPPDLTRLSISDIIAHDAFLDDRFPFVLAADPSGLLLVTDSYGRAMDPLGADRPVYFVWDAARVSTHRIRGHEESVNHSGNVGLIVTPTHRPYHNFTVVELLPVSAGDSVAILCYDSNSRVWVKKTLPFPMLYHPWSSATVFSHEGKLWWVDLRHGILSCDPFADDDPQAVLFVPFPDGAAALLRRGGDISKHRCVNLSDGKLRFVEMAGSARVPRVVAWTLVDPEACLWELHYDVKLREIWADESYERTELPMKTPVLAGVHPADPAVVYFFNMGKLFGVNLGTNKVDQCSVAFQHASTDPMVLDIDEESSRFLLTWDLPPSLTSSSGRNHGNGLSAQTNGERTPRTAALNMLSYFMNAYTCAFGNSEYDVLARIAIVHLNRKLKKRENKFRLSERHLLCSFDEKKDRASSPKRYAHMNFYVLRDSKAKRLRHLVFAEFVKADTDDGTGCSWTLLSCKILTKNNNGGVSDTNVDAGQKTKRSWCFPCDSEMKHPTNGFFAGHLHCQLRLPSDRDQHDP